MEGAIAKNNRRRKQMTNLSALSAIIVFVLIAFPLYFGVLPLVNDYSCNLLVESNIGSLSRIAFQSIAGCWVPWG